MMAGRVLAHAALLCVLGQAEARADAGPLAVALEYSATPDCPEVGDFKAIVNGRLGYDPFREGAPERVFVQIASRAPAFEGRIEWRNAEGKWAGDRTFPSRSADCRELARAMAFALALQIQLSASASAPSAPSAVEPAEASPPAEAQVASPVSPASAPLPNAQQSVAVPSQVAAAESPSRVPGPVLAVGAGALAGFHVSSGVVPFGRVFGSLAWPHWSLELATEVGLPTTERRGDGAGFSQQELLVGLAGCGTLARWSACLLAKGGALRIAGEAVEEPASPWGPLFEMGLRLAVTQPIGRRVYVAVRAEGLLIVTRWQVSLDDTPVWRSSRFTETIGFDVGVRFP
jgi:hypothetical protein